MPEPPDIPQRDELLRTGAQQLAQQAEKPSWAGALATGGWLGLLLFASLHSLVTPATLTVPAIVKILESLGLNIASNYLGNALDEMVRRTVGRSDNRVSQQELLQALLQVIDRHEDAAAELAQAARDSGVLQETLNAIRRRTAGSAELLVGLVQDSRRHGAAMAELQADLRQGLGVIYQLAVNIQGDTTAIRTQTGELLRLAREDRAALRELARRLAEEHRRRQQQAEVLLRSYLGTLSESSNRLSLADADSSDPGKAAVDLDSVYIRLELTRTEEQQQSEQRRAAGEQPRHLTALELLARQSWLVLLGAPGSGKSTFVNFLTRCLAQHYLTGAQHWLERLGPEWPHGGLLPVRVILREFTAWVAEQHPRIDQGAADLFWRFLADQQSPALSELLCHAACDGRVLLLLDGLDEVGSDEQNWPLLPVCASIAALAGSVGAGSPVLVTCRILDYQQPQRRLATWPAETLQPLSATLQQAFISNWYNELERLGRPMNDTPERLKQRLQQQVRTRPELRRLAGNPLLLTMMTLVHAYKGRLPEERVRLYDECIEFLLHRWRVRPDQPALRDRLKLSQWSETNLYDLLELLGHATHVRGVHPDGESGADLPYDQLITIAQGYFAAYGRGSYGRAEDFADYIGQASNGVLQVYERQHATEVTYRFPHRTFQEYLAGRALTNDSLQLADESDAAERDLVTRALRYVDTGAQWREALLLAASRHALIGRRSREVVGLARSLPQDLPDTADPAQLARRTILAGEILLEVGRESVARLGRSQITVWQQTQANLVDLLTRPERLERLPPVERDRAGLTLAQLGDPLDPTRPGDTRPGVCTLEPDLCGPFPAGEYPIAEGKAAHRLETFSIARYPVTVWQYRQFIQAGGYADAQWWTPAGWQWLQPGGLRYSHQEQGRITQPSLWDNPAWTADNQPVVGVSWYEAVAFCNWLTQQGRQARWLEPGMQIRLPTEAEWEVAAMWDAQVRQMRPWQPPAGAIWQNVPEAGIGRTAPVGIFPQGASPCGALDMAGNVWEWCSSGYKDYPDQAEQIRPDFKPREFGPVLRGGSYSLQNTRSGWGARGRLGPSYPNFYRGFRVCVLVAPRSGEF